jgi:hypothetical protein
MWYDIFFFSNSFVILMDDFTVTKCFINANICVISETEHSCCSAGSVATHCMLRLPLFHV